MLHKKTNNIFCTPQNIRNCLFEHKTSLKNIISMGPHKFFNYSTANQKKKIFTLNLKPAATFNLGNKSENNDKCRPETSQEKTKSYITLLKKSN